MTQAAGMWGAPGGVLCWEMHCSTVAAKGWAAGGETGVQPAVAPWGGEEQAAGANLGAARWNRPRHKCVLGSQAPVMTNESFRCVLWGGTKKGARVSGNKHGIQKRFFFQLLVTDMIPQENLWELECRNLRGLCGELPI